MAGEIDARFGQCGTVMPPVVPVPVDEEARAVAIQPDGKIVAAGSAAPSRGPGAQAAAAGAQLDPHGTRNFRLVRLAADGSLDDAFDGIPANVNEPRRLPGRVTMDFQGGSDDAAGLAIQPDGKIVAAGFATISDGADGTPRMSFAVARFEPLHGRPDPSFKGITPLPGRGGNATIDFGIGGAAASAVAIDPGPPIKIVTVGSARLGMGFGGPFSIMALARPTNFGKPDSSFGSAGKITIERSEFGDRLNAVALQNDGKIVAGGATGSEDRTRAGIYTLLRFSGDGTLDETFGDGGVVISPDLEGLVGLAIQPDGKIVGLDARFTAARHNSDGSVDTAFGRMGVAPTEFSGLTASGSALALQPNGKIVLAGSVGNVDEGAFALVRLQPDGALDDGFGDGGVDVARLGEDAAANALAIQADGKIVVVGRVVEPIGMFVGTRIQHRRFAFARHLGDR